LLADEGFDVYNYHQVGAGLSSRLGASQCTVDRHVVDLDAIRVILGAEKVILIGASWGGQLIAEYMAAHPARVERAVVVSPNASGPRRSLKING
jgi:proline iminopeptidase